VGVVHFWRGRGLVLMLVGWASLVAGASALTVPDTARAGLSWSFSTRPDDARIAGHSNGLADVACPSMNRCVAVDGQAEITFDPLAQQSPLPVIIDPDGYGPSPTAGGLDSVACPSVDQCTAADGVGREVTFDPGLPGDPIPVTIDGARALQAIACPTINQCTAVDGTGREVTFDPLAPGAPAPVTIDGGRHLSGPNAPGVGMSAIACPSADQCTATDFAGREVTFDPAAPGTPAVVAVDTAADGAVGVACPSVQQCTDIGVVGDEVTFDPDSPGRPVSAVVDAAAADDAGSTGSTVMGGIACPSASECVTVDSNGEEVMFDPSSPASATFATPKQFPSGGGFALAAVACPSGSRCTAVDNNGDELSFTPGAAPAATRYTIDPQGFPLTGVTCPMAGMCTAVDEDGQAVTLDPSSTGERLVTSVGLGPDLHAIACPLVTQCTGVDYQGDQTTFDPAAPGNAPFVRINRGQASLADIACPAPGQCTAIASHGEITFPPLATGSRRFVRLPGSPPLRALACPSVSECVAVNAGGHAVTFNPRAPRHPRVVDVAPSGGGFAAIACPAVRQCTAVGSNGRVVTFDPSPPTHARMVAVDPGAAALTGIACPSARFCIATDVAGHALQGDPRGGLAWTTEPVHGAAAEVSCLSVSYCVGVDGLGDVFLGTSRKPPAPTQTQLKALLDGIAAHHAGASARSLVRYEGGYGGYEFSVFLPASGKVTVNWYEAMGSAPRAHSRRVRKGVMVATTGRTPLSDGSGAQLSMDLTSKGAKIFRKRGRVALVAQATLSGRGRRLVSSLQPFTMEIP
jgi:hypothetical protein